MFSLNGLAMHLHRNVQNYHREVHNELEKVGRLVQGAAKQVIGTYNYGWPQLAAMTQADRLRQGYAANDPLLRTGELRASIGYTMGKIGDGWVEIGSNNKKAVWQELGTDRIPPRSFLAESVIHNEKLIVNLIGQSVQKILLMP
jgi:hypothetical protein